MAWLLSWLLLTGCSYDPKVSQILRTFGITLRARDASVGRPSAVLCFSLFPQPPMSRLGGSASPLTHVCDHCSDLGNGGQKASAQSVDPGQPSWMERTSPTGRLAARPASSWTSETDGPQTPGRRTSLAVGRESRGANKPVCYVLGDLRSSRGPGSRSG